jgi:hypothetical protein
MKLKLIASGALLKYLTAAVLLLGVANLAQAQTHPAGADGTWIWSTPGRNGGADRTNTLTLKADGPKLTGKLSAPGRGGPTADTSISEGKVDGDTVSFLLVREQNGNSSTNKYSGKIAGEKITGKIETSRDGETQSRDWEATRSGSTP